MSEHPADTVQMIGATVRFVPMPRGAGYELSEWDVEPGAAGPPIHVHHEHDEGFYVLSGRFGFSLDGVTTYGKPGAHVLAPRGHAHSFWNAGPEPARCLIIVSPPGLEDYFRALGDALRGTDTQEGSIAVRKRLAETYDLEVVGPPGGPDQEGARGA